MFLRLLTNELSVSCTVEHGMPIVSICLWLVQFLGGLIQRQTFSGKKGLLSGKSTFEENALEGGGGTKDNKPNKNNPQPNTGFYRNETIAEENRLLKKCIHFSWSGPKALIYISSLYDTLAHLIPFRTLQFLFQTSLCWNVFSKVPWSCWYCECYLNDSFEFLRTTQPGNTAFSSSIILKFF